MGSAVKFDSFEHSGAGVAEILKSEPVRTALIDLAEPIAETAHREAVVNVVADLHMDGPGDIVYKPMYLAKVKSLTHTAYASVRPTGLGKLNEQLHHTLSSMNH